MPENTPEVNLFEVHGITPPPPENLVPRPPDMHPFEHWIETCTRPGCGWISTAALFASWSAYTQHHKIFTGSVNRFSTALRKRGWVKMRARDQKSNGFAGRELK